MKTDAHRKYQPFTPVSMPRRNWPDSIIDHAPIWCSVDLRDGNQALIEPMDSERKRRMFRLLVDLGFKEIEVGFPAASQTDYDFVRSLIEENLIPNDVTIQVLTQSREPLIRKTFDALKGAHRAIVHLYNSTSPTQREIVFGMDRKGITDIAEKGARFMNRMAAESPETQWIFQYSPESFSATELDFSLEICEKMMAIWQPTPEHRVILNLPATVEMSTPNIHADQIEWFCNHLKNRDCAIISVHPHNDRGTAVAAAELALMAGADRVEGTLFGNGERTGNVDILTLALNLFTQGVNPELDFSDINQVVREAEYCNQMSVPPRHPYAGDLVFTAFSGSHQDAIKKGFDKMAGDETWNVPYLPIDPNDLGRDYEAIIRVNSQSGKGGIAYLLKRYHGLQMPRRLQMEFSSSVQKLADQSGKELSTPMLWQLFQEDYLHQQTPYCFLEYREVSRIQNRDQERLTASIQVNGQERLINGEGNGPIDAFVNAMNRQFGTRVRIVDYHEHAIGSGADAAAMAYVEIRTEDGCTLFGAGSDSNIVTASLKAVISAINRLTSVGHDQRKIA